MTAAVTLVPITTGTITVSSSFFLDGAPGTTAAPVTAHLIDHPTRGTAVFDSGLGRRFSRRDGTPASGAADLEDSCLIQARITAAGYDPSTVSVIANSHLHTDHAGGNSCLPNARVLVQHREWQHALTSDDPAYHRPDFTTGQHVHLIDGEHDVFGDGTFVLHPTPGHTPGHQSAQVTTAHGTAILAGDACNLRANLDEFRLPDHVHDAGAYRRTLRWFADRRADGAEIFYGHDPEFWAGIEQGAAWKGPQPS